MAVHGSGLCPTRNQPDHFGFFMFRPAADWWTESVRVVGFSPGLDQSSVGFGLCEYLPDFAKSRRILMRPRRISKRSSRSWRDMVGSWWDLGISRRDQAKSRRDLTWLFDFRLDLNKSDRKWEIFLRVQAGFQQIG